MKANTLEAVLHAKATTPMRLLILEHSQHDAELILLELKDAGLAVEHTLVQNQEQFRQALRQGHFDVVLSDYRLPGWTGLDALEDLRTFDKNLPFLLVTGTLGEEAAVECIKQGVSDCILKDHIFRLPAALKRAMHEKNLREENVRAYKRTRRKRSTSAPAIRGTRPVIPYGAGRPGHVRPGVAFLADQRTSCGDQRTASCRSHPP